MSPLYQGLLFLINTFFDIFLFVLVVRFILAWSGANYFDPITQFVVNLTNFIVKPLRRFIPNIRQCETASLVLILVFEIIKFYVISLLSMGVPNVTGILMLAVADMGRLFVQTLFYAILIQVIMSWIQPISPLNNTLYQITSPILRPIQRALPLMAGMDISPIPAMIILQLLLIVLINPLTSTGLVYAFN